MNFKHMPELDWSLGYPYVDADGGQRGGADVVLQEARLAQRVGPDRHLGKIGL